MTARTGKGTTRRKAGVVLGVLLVLIIGVTITFAVLRPDPGITTDCTAYGVPADDDRAQAPEIRLLQDHPEVDRNQGSGRTPLPRSHNWGETADGVILGQTFRSDGVRSRYHLFTRGVDFDRPVGLLVRLHGDGAYEYDHPDGLTNCLAVIAASHNLITLVPRTPDDLTYTWWQDISENLGWLNALLDKVVRDFNVDRDNTWWMGYSGGAELLSYGLIPRSPELITGGAVLLGGGGAPTNQELRVPDPLRENMELHWITGRRDDGTDPREPFDSIAAAEAGAAWYRGHGFSEVHTEFPAEHDHFSLPQAGIMADILDTAAARD